MLVNILARLIVDWLAPHVVMVALPEGKAEAEATKDTRRREAEAVRDEKEGIVCLN
jgi:hypothetical protein